MDITGIDFNDFELVEKICETLKSAVEDLETLCDRIDSKRMNTHDEETRGKVIDTEKHLTSIYNQLTVTKMEVATIKDELTDKMNGGNKL